MTERILPRVAMTLEERLDRLERGTYKLKLGRADLVSLEPNMVAVLITPRPLGEANSRAITAAWAATVEQVGMHTPLLLLSGIDGQLTAVMQDG